MKKRLLISLIAVVLVGGIAFYGGTMYAKSNQPAGFAGRGSDAQNFRANAGGAGGLGRGTSLNGGFVTGTVVSKDTQGITVELNGPDGDQTGTGSKVVLVGDSTQVVKSEAGSLDDIAEGANVTVNGTPNSDGSLTATMIQLRSGDAPIPGGFGGFRDPTGADGGTQQ